MASFSDISSNICDFQRNTEFIINICNDILNLVKREYPNLRGYAVISDVIAGLNLFHSVYTLAFKQGPKCGLALFDLELILENIQTYPSMSTYIIPELIKESISDPQYVNTLRVFKEHIFGIDHIEYRTTMHDIIQKHDVKLARILFTIAE